MTDGKGPVHFAGTGGNSSCPLTTKNVKAKKSPVKCQEDDVTKGEVEVMVKLKTDGSSGSQKGRSV